MILWEEVGTYDSDFRKEIAMFCDTKVVGAFAHESCANDDCGVVSAFCWGWMDSMEC